MLLCCSRCHNEFVAFKEPINNKILCNKCSPHTEISHNKLGIHPVLEKQWSTAINPKKDRALEIANRKTLFNQTYIQNTPSVSYTSSPKIPGYDIYYEIGRGAMGGVFKAKKIKEGKMVALKILSQELANRPDLVARFEREIFALRSLKHKNIVSIIDSGSIDKIHYFAMEFIEGITLRTYIGKGILDFHEASFITMEILQGLQYAHEHGIIHRDLKPENVLLEYDDQDFSKLPLRVILVDFGLVGIGALGFDPHPNLTRSKVTMGTVNYMAPEQHIDAKRVDFRSDIYSCGVMLFEMLTSDLPIGRYLMPSERGISLPINSEEIIVKSLARNLNERYACAKDFLKDLQLIHQDYHQKSASMKSNIFDYYKNNKNSVLYTALFLFSLLFFSFGIKLSLG